MGKGVGYRGVWLWSPLAFSLLEEERAQRRCRCAGRRRRAASAGAPAPLRHAASALLFALRQRRVVERSRRWPSGWQNKITTRRERPKHKNIHPNYTTTPNQYNNKCVAKCVPAKLKCRHITPYCHLLPVLYTHTHTLSHRNLKKANIMF